MEKYNIHKDIKKRYGSRLADGKAHVEQHEMLSRRSFLRSTGLLTMGSLLSVNGFAIGQFKPNALINSLISDDSDRVLVLIRLNGGNDGLNTIIQRGNDEYYNIRPTLAVQESGLWALSDEIGMPNSMNALQDLWENDRMKIIHNVGYPQPNYSHFRSSDIWASASDSHEIVNTGWIGRAMEAEFGSYIETPPSVPPAIQIGIESNLIFTGNNANMALSISNPTEFYRIAQQGQLYSTNNLSDCPHESELKYARQTANNAFRYSSSIQEAYRNGTTKTDYPQNYLAEQLAIVARLIKGRLGTKVYMVTIGGFDTHSEQAGWHDELLTNIATSVKAFMDDLDADDLGDKVLGMTFSEFGRTVFENGSLGTDHGTGGPMLLFGGSDLGSGFVGTPPDLYNLDQYGDPYYDIDFRSVYASVLGAWLGIEDRVLDHVLDDQQLIDGLVPQANIPTGINGDKVLLGFKASTGSDAVDIHYSLSKGGITHLNLLQLNGRVYRKLIDSYKDEGSHTYRLDKQKDLVSPGSYLLEIRNNGKMYRRIIHL